MIVAGRWIELRGKLRMGQRPSDRRGDGDLPWNDSPADGNAIPGRDEPDPAEVIGDEDRPHDVSLPRRQDWGDRETLDERLREEEPDTGPGSPRAGDEGMEIVEADGEDPFASQGQDQEDSDLPAEEAALHEHRGPGK